MGGIRFAFPMNVHRTSFLAALFLTALGGSARAATDPPLPPALERPVVRVFHRVALAVAGDAGSAALAARREVVQALEGAGHQVVVLEGAPISLPPAHDLLVAISRQHDASALVVVQAAGIDPAAISVSLYNLGGSLLFDFSARVLPPVMPIVPPASMRPIDLRSLPLLDGSDLYRALGRPDLAASYERRRSVKIGLRVAGGVALGVGVVWGIVDLLVVSFAAGAQTVLCVPTADTGSTGSICQGAPSLSGIPWLVALGGLGMVVAPAFISTDPLNASEKRALLYGTPTSLSFSIAPTPAADGATFVAGGHF